MAMITCINLLLLTGAPFFSAELHTDLASHSSVNKFNVDFCPHSLRVSTNSSLVNLPKKELTNESFDKDMNKEMKLLQDQVKNHSKKVQVEFFCQKFSSSRQLLSQVVKVKKSRGYLFPRHSQSFLSSRQSYLSQVVSSASLEKPLVCPRGQIILDPGDEFLRCLIAFVFEVETSTLSILMTITLMMNSSMMLSKSTRNSISVACGCQCCLMS